MNLPEASKRSLRIGGIVAAVLLISVLVAGVATSLWQPAKVGAVLVEGSSTTSRPPGTTTTAPFVEPEAHVGDTAGDGNAATTTVVTETQSGSSGQPAGSGSPSSGPKKHSASSDQSSQSSSSASSAIGGCQPVGCNGGHGDHYTADVDAGNGQHTVGGGPGGTAKTVPDKPGQVVQAPNQ